MNWLRALFVILVSSFIAGNALAASAPLELYQATPVVTGTGETNRRIGFALAFEDVLVKVSGDPRLIGTPRVDALAKDAGTFVQEFHYRDRMEGTPIHDEQGSHDRPHDLTTVFVPKKIDAVLASLGSRPWAGTRPTLTLFLHVERGDRRFVLSSDNASGVDMRESLGNAARKTGIPVTLPTSTALEAAGATGPAAPDANPATLQQLTAGAGGSHALVGSLVWSDKELGWIADWRMTADAKPYRWQVRGVSFDDAFRNAVRGAAQVLSGNGQPD